VLRTSAWRIVISSMPGASTYAQTLMSASGHVDGGPEVTMSRARRASGQIVWLAAAISRCVQGRETTCLRTRQAIAGAGNVMDISSAPRSLDRAEDCSDQRRDRPCDPWAQTDTDGELSAPDRDDPAAQRAAAHHVRHSRDLG